MTDQDLFALSALRYALGRKTYIVDIVSRQFQKNVEENRLSPAAIANAIEEIDRAENNPLVGLGHDCDKRTWYELRSWLKKHIAV